MPPRDDPMEQTFPPGTILEFGQRITRVETRMDSLERTVDTGFEQVMGRLNEGSQKFAIQNGKISKLQQWRMYILGGIGVLVFLVYLFLEAYKTFGG